MHIAVIGIDRYRDRDWQTLENAVSDARGAWKTFTELGFSPFRKPLLNEEATHATLNRLVTDDLSQLGKDDSLVLFFAGHGCTVTKDYSDGPPSRRGYILPCDADRQSIATWLRLDSWLSDVAHLPPKHILVILDACYSGIALDHAVSRWRGVDVPLPEAMEALRARRSRRVITSARADQRAMDGGPRPGHSLFTGCLIEALTGQLAAETKRSLVTGSEIALHVQRRVADHAHSQQTPDFGELELHNRGELIVRLPGFGSSAEGSEERPGAGRRRKRRRKPDPKRQPPASHGPEESDREPAPDIDDSRPDPAVIAALDRHAAERARGARVLTVVAGDAMVVLAGWAAWAAGRGYLTLGTEGRSLDATIAELLAQIPWLRCIAGARASLAAAAHLDVAAVDASLDARSSRERSRWIDNVAGLDRRARVSGWLLSALREPRAQIPDLTTAPVQGGELLSVVCKLAAPIAVLIQHPEPTAPWLERAISIAAALVAYLPDHAIAVGAPGELVSQVLEGDRQSASLSMARQGMVPIAARAEGSVVRTRSRAARRLHEALAGDARTAGQLALNVEVPLYAGGPVIEVDLAAESVRLAIEIDGWYHFGDPQGYRTARITDLRLQRAGFFVLRFLAEDVTERLAHVIDEIAIALRSRRASSPSHGEAL